LSEPPPYCRCESKQACCLVLVVADGSVVLKVLSCDPSAGELICCILNSATIGERKNMNLPGVVVDLPTLTAKDIDDIQNWGIKHNVDFIAASFVRKQSDVEKIREVLGSAGAHIKIICKIENLEGVQNYMDILKSTDGIMVARGDLGMEIPPEKVFLAQKYMIREANIVGKPVVTATQMLESMVTNPRPTRAECSDVANAVLDGSDCVMLSGETANGDYPTDAVQIMARICCEAEGAINMDSLYQAVRNSTLHKFGFLTTSESIASSAVKTAIDVRAKAIIVCSESGNTARQVAKFRPGMPVLVVTTKIATARQCYGWLKGCTSKYIGALPIDTWQEETEKIIRDTVAEWKAAGKIAEGETVVVVHGHSANVGATNTMLIQYA